MRFNKPCLACGELSKDNYCPTCKKAIDRRRDADPIRREKKRTLYSNTYRKNAALVRATATTCHLCGEGYKPHDPWEADHIYPHLGDASPLAPAHRSCNQTRGNKPLH